MSRRIPILFEGRRIEARAGESVAAALVGHGIGVFRTTRGEMERGLFCGMGVCQDCLVEIDGEPNRRACMTSVDRPIQVRRQHHGQKLATIADAPLPATIETMATERPELLVIGAGPGGLSAAVAAREAGVEVVVVDERGAAGGQYFKQVAAGGDVALPDAQHREGAALIQDALAKGVRIHSGTTIWGAFPPGEFAASSTQGAIRYLPEATIIATGAYERGWAVPGWTLPGVMTTGAAQTLWRTARRLPGKRVLIAGNGPLNLQLAAELVAGGSQVVAVVEAAGLGVGGIGSLAAMAAASPSLLAGGIGYHLRRLTGRVPMIHGQVVSRVEQAGAGLRVALAAASGNGRSLSFDADALCLGYGFEPSNELLRALGCRHDFSSDHGQLVTRRDASGRTSVAGIYALGDCTGLGGARIAIADGVLAGLAAAEDLGRPIGPELARERRRAERQAARHRRFQRALWRIYRAPAPNLGNVPDETVMCRCEETTYGDVRHALRRDPGDAGAVKRATRLGMGPCQGRYCRPMLEALMSEISGEAPDEFSGFAPRLPVKPVAIRDLAARADV